MILESQWQKAGVIGEADAPVISLEKLMILATRISPLINLTEVTEKVAGISHATVWWSSEPNQTKLKVWTRLDSGAWQEVQFNGEIPGIKAARQSLQVKVALSSPLLELEVGHIPKISELTVCFYDRHLEYTEGRE